MGSLNAVTLIGHLGKDAELKYTPGGAAVATLNLATSENWTDKQGQKQEKTEWHRVVLWGKTAEAVAEYLTKGKQVCVQGKLQTRQWDDKDGNKRYTTEIRGDRVVLLGSAEKQRRDERSPEPPETANEDMDVDDIPFAWLLPLLLPIAAAMMS